jgi:polyhydroxyalkanoate synthesis regulator phasin
MKRWNVVMDIMLKSANMPTKQEIDEIYKELHSMKQKISKLESSTKKSDKNDAE